MTEVVHGEGYDVDLVERYLKDHPRPSVSTMEGWIAPETKRIGWHEFLQEPREYQLKILQKAMPEGNVIMDDLPMMSLRNLLHVENEGEPVELEPCEVVAVSKPEPYEEFKRFKCRSCKEMQIIPREELGAKKTCDCDSPNLFELPQLKQDSVDSQFLKLQEIQYDGSDIPITINALLKGKDMVWSVKFNERVCPIGVLRYRKVYNARTRETEYKDWFEIFGVKKIDPDVGVRLTESDIEYIKSEMAKPGFYNKLIRSFAPSIWGMHSFKEAIILALASIKMPKPARLLMVTDPGMAKSKLIKYTCSLVSNAYSVQMGRATKTGLTISSERDEETGRRHVGRGAFAQAHKGLLCIDEMQMGEAKDFANLNDVMESMQLKYAFPGGNVGYIDANCALIMACNPHEGNFAGEQAIGEILKFMGNDTPQFTSRTQLILMRRDRFTSEEQRKIAEHMSKHNENNPLYMQRYYENWLDESDMEEIAIQIVPGLTAVFTVPSERFGTKWIKKIFKYVINYVQVSEMPDEHTKTLVDYYMHNRSDVATSVNKMITNRFMEHGQNLAMYMARVKGKSSPTEEEILHTMEVLERSMSVAAFDPKTMEFDANMFNNSHPRSKIEKMSKMQQWVEGCHNAMKNSEDGKYFTEQQLINELASLPKSKWTDGSNISQHIQKFMSYGKIMQKGDRYTWLD